MDAIQLRSASCCVVPMLRVVGEKPPMATVESLCPMASKQSGSFRPPSKASARPGQASIDIPSTLRFSGNARVSLFSFKGRAISARLQLAIAADAEHRPGWLTATDD